MQTFNNNATFKERALSILVPFLRDYSKIPFSDKNIALTDQTSQNERYVYYGKETLNAASKGILLCTALVVTASFIQVFYEQSIRIAVGGTLAAGFWKLSQNPGLVGAVVEKVTTFANANQKATFPTVEKKNL